MIALLANPETAVCLIAAALVLVGSCVRFGDPVERFRSTFNDPRRDDPDWLDL